MSSLIVIPAHNEAPTVQRVVAAVRDRTSADVLVVDDGSSDGTAALARAAGARVVRGRRGGYGAALLRGFEAAMDEGYERIATIDADGQHDPRELPRILELARDWDIVSGTRYHPRSPVVGSAPADRMRINREMTRRVNALTGYGLTDAFCGFKAYRVEALRRVPLDEPGYAFPLQFWVRAARAGLTVTEVPVGKIYLPVSRSFGGGLDDPVARRAYYLRVLEAEASESLPQVQ